MFDNLPASAEWDGTSAADKRSTQTMIELAIHEMAPIPIAIIALGYPVHIGIRIHQAR
jgi:hypothetical protein